MTAKYVIVAAFLAGIVSGQLPFHAFPAYGIGGIGSLGYAGGAGAFSHGFGQFPGFSPYYGISYSLPLPVSAAGAAGTTHTVSHTSAAVVPHPAASHVNKAVTVAHHFPSTHVTTVHHPVSAVTTHEQHVNHGPAFHEVVPYSPFFYGPTLSQFGPQYRTSFVKHQPIPATSHSTVVKSTSQTSSTPGSYLDLVKKLSSSAANVAQPSTIYSYQNYKPVASVVTKTQHLPVGYPYNLPNIATTRHHQTVSHVGPEFGVAHLPSLFPGTLSASTTKYQQTTAYPGLGYSYGPLPGTFNSPFGAFGTPFPYVNAGFPGGAVSSSAVHTVHHPGAFTPALYPSAFQNYPVGTSSPVSFYSVPSSHLKITKTKSQKSSSNNKK
uniref:Suckerin-7 n=1 Tax=Acanthosepion esculentum TaxID=31210 RepID=A0A081DUA5_ACAES